MQNQGDGKSISQEIEKSLVPINKEKEKGATMVENYGATRMESLVFKYGMRLYPFDMCMPPTDELVCVGKGGLVKNVEYYNFIYYTHPLDEAIAEKYELDYIGVAHLTIEEL